MKVLLKRLRLFVVGSFYLAAVSVTASADGLPAARHGQSATARKAILKDFNDSQESVTNTIDEEKPETTRARLSSAAESEPDKTSSTSSVHGRHGRSAMARESILKD